MGILRAVTSDKLQETRWRRAQSVLKYATMIAVMAAMLLAMSIYVKRALCGRWRQVGDVFGSGRQFEYSGPSQTTVSN